MKKQYLVILILAFIIIPVNTFSSDKNSALKEINNDKPGKASTKLFNGRDLDGWYTYVKGRGKNSDPLNVFTITKGMIRISGEEFG